MLTEQEGCECRRVCRPVTMRRLRGCRKPPVFASILRRSESVKARAGLLTRSCSGAFPALWPVAKIAGTRCGGGEPLSGNLQQRVLLLIFTAFPFNPLPRVDGGTGNLCGGKGNIIFRAAKSCGRKISGRGGRPEDEDGWILPNFTGNLIV